MINQLIKNFVLGDFLFGLDNDRNKYMNDILSKLGDKNALITVDRFNNPRIGFFSTNNQTSPDNKFHKFVNEQKMFKRIRGKRDSSNEKKSIRIRRSCKLAFNYAKENDCKIRFVLDSLDLARVVAKFNIEHKTDDVSNTGSELRYIFRYKDTLEDTVVFYKFGSIVPAPWKEAQMLWRDNYYNEQRCLKSKKECYENFIDGFQSRKRVLQYGNDVYSTPSKKRVSQYDNVIYTTPPRKRILKYTQDSFKTP
jgi:hypothetical protein